MTSTRSRSRLMAAVAPRGQRGLGRQRDPGVGGRRERRGHAALVEEAVADDRGEDDVVAADGEGDEADVRVDLAVDLGRDPHGRAVILMDRQPVLEVPGDRARAGCEPGRGLATGEHEELRVGAGRAVAAVVPRGAGVARVPRERPEALACRVGVAERDVVALDAAHGRHGEVHIRQAVHPPDGQPGHDEGHGQDPGGHAEEADEGQEHRPLPTAEVGRADDEERHHPGTHSAGHGDHDVGDGRHDGETEVEHEAVDHERDRSDDEQREDHEDVLAALQEGPVGVHALEVEADHQRGDRAVEQARTEDAEDVAGDVQATGGQQHEHGGHDQPAVEEPRRGAAEVATIDAPVGRRGRPDGRRFGLVAARGRGGQRVHGDLPRRVSEEERRRPPLQIRQAASGAGRQPRVA